jgi:GNAT superfamily N-acetyltransferase
LTETSKPLTESVLRRLTNDALSIFMSESAGLELAARPGLLLALTNEAIADMNMLVAGKGADRDHFRDMAQSCLGRELPFLAMIFPEAGDALDATAAELGLVHAVNFPMMVRDDMPLEADGNPDAVVTRACSAEHAEGMAAVMASAYSMPIDAVRNCFPPSFFETPAADVYVASLQGEILGSVTLTYHGDTCGIWAMGTNADRQYGGVGRRLLSTAMCEARASGLRRFFLGATPAGYRLYEQLGYRTVCEARIWVSGETHQA